MDNAVKPAQPHLEVVTPRRQCGSTSEQASDLHRHSLRGVHRAEPERQRDRDVPGRQRERRRESSRLKCA